MQIKKTERIKIEVRNMLQEKPVRGCMCYSLSFAQLKAMAEANGWRTAADITAAVGCGGGCGLCRPYLRRMLETGETAFDVLPPDSADTNSAAEPQP